MTAATLAAPPMPRLRRRPECDRTRAREAERRYEVHELRRADDPGRAEAPLPRQGLGAPCSPRPPGAGDGGESGDRDAVEEARSFAKGARGGQGNELLSRGGAGGHRSSGELRGDIA